MKRMTWSSAVVVTLAAAFGPMGGEAADKAAPWDFKMEKLWELQKIGSDSLLRPGEPRVAEDGTLYFRDFERKLSYIVDADGRPLGSFAAQGPNEGEVPFYFNCFTAGENVVIGAPDKLHFFSKEGKFLKAVPNNLFVLFPLAFKNENEYWVAPATLGDAGKDTVSLIHVNLASGEEATVHSFALTAGENKPSGGAVVLGVTPQMLLSYAPQFDLICFGKNSDTVIYWRPAGGGEGGSFAFSSTVRAVSEADKRNHAQRCGIPEERVAMMIAALPDQMAYYHRIQVVDGLIYLFSAESIDHAKAANLVDVFSPDGHQLYHGQFRLEPGWHASGPDALRLASGWLYAVQENEAGAKKVAKYRVALPTP